MVEALHSKTAWKFLKKKKKHTCNNYRDNLALMLIYLREIKIHVPTKTGT